MAANLLCILVVEAQHELAKGIVAIDALLQFPADEGQLEVKVVAVAGLQVVQQGGHADALVAIVDGVVVDGVVDHGQEGVAVNTIQLTGLFHGLVAKTEMNAECS